MLKTIRDKSYNRNRTQMSTLQGAGGMSFFFRKDVASGPGYFTTSSLVPVVGATIHLDNADYFGVDVSATLARLGAGCGIRIWDTKRPKKFIYGAITDAVVSGGGYNLTVDILSGSLGTSLNNLDVFGIGFGSLSGAGGGGGGTSFSGSIPYVFKVGGGEINKFAFSDPNSYLSGHDKNGADLATLFNDMTTSSARAWIRCLSKANPANGFVRAGVLAWDGTYLTLTGETAAEFMGTGPADGEEVVVEIETTGGATGATGCTGAAGAPGTNGVDGISMPIGGICAWHNNLPGCPDLPPQYQICNGATITDVASPMYGQATPPLCDVLDYDADGFQASGYFIRGTMCGGSAHYTTGSKVGGFNQNDARSHIHTSCGSYVNTGCVYGLPACAFGNVVSGPGCAVYASVVKVNVVTGLGLGYINPTAPPAAITMRWVMRIK